MAVELREINKDGSWGEILPDWSNLTFSQDLLAAGSLTFDYPVDGRNSSILTHGTTLSCLLDGVEPVNGRFTYNESSGDRLGNAGAGVASYGCVSNMSRFLKMSLSPAFGSLFADENMFSFTNQTAGWLFKNAIDNSMSRGYQLSADPQPWLNHPILTFDEMVDSSGVVWPTTYDAKFPPGTTTVQGVLDWLVQNGFAEARMEGKDVKLFNPSSNGRDLTIGKKPIVIQTGRDLIEATYATTSTDLVNALLVLGDDNTCAWVYDTDSVAKYGYREATLQVSSASSVETLTAAGNAYLSTRSIPRYSYTYSVSALYLDSIDPNPRPFLDYQVGDSILVLDAAATAVQRVRLLSATWPDARSSSVNITVNDFFSERDAEFDRRLSRLGLSS